MTPDEVPADLVEKAAEAIVGQWDAAAVMKIQGTPESFAVSFARHALAAVLPEAQEQAWDAGADIAARAAVILGAPKDLPERVRGHNPHRAAETEGRS